MAGEAINIHAALIKKCRKNDRMAQFEVYKLYSKSMFNTALRITGSHSDAEDVLQDAFVSAFQNLSSYREEAPFGAWLKKIVVNKSLNHVHKSKRDFMIVDDIEEHDKAEEMIEVDEPIYNVEDLKKSINQLPSGFRTVLSLYLFEGYDHKEIGEILSITESTSKSQYKRAKDKLKIIMKNAISYG